MSEVDHLAAARLLRLKHEIDAKLLELSQIQGDAEFVRELAFVAEFKSLTEKYEFTTNDALAIMDPRRLFSGGFSTDVFFEKLQTVSKEEPGVSPHRGRALMRYRNPSTGEVVETKGTNHKKIREWRKAHGRQTVETWREL